MALTFPDSGWLKAFDLREGVLVSFIITGTLILFIYDNNLHASQEIPFSLFLIILSFTVISASLLAAKTFNLLEKTINEIKTTINFRKRILILLDNVTDEEKEILSYLLQKNLQFFQAEFKGRKLSTLEQKGILGPLSGRYEVMYWPYKINDFVWEKLQDKKDEFNTADVSSSYPWYTPWRER